MNKLTLLAEKKKKDSKTFTDSERPAKCSQIIVKFLNVKLNFFPSISVVQFV